MSLEIKSFDNEYQLWYGGEMHGYLKWNGLEFDMGIPEWYTTNVGIARRCVLDDDIEQSHISFYQIAKTLCNRYNLEHQHTLTPEHFNYTQPEIRKAQDKYMQYDKEKLVQIILRQEKMLKDLGA